MTAQRTALQASFVQKKKIPDLKKIKYIEDLNIISRVNPLLGVCFAITFFSIAGVPPFAGFFSKMFLFFSTINQSLYFLTAIGVLTSVVSCFYYLRIIQISYFEQVVIWVTLKKLTKEICLLIGCVLLLLSFFFLHPTLLIVLIHNSVLNLCI